MYWNALQRENCPVCIFQPTDAEQIGRALVEVIRVKCPFAIKSGGHSSNVEGSSIHGGFQFDLSKMTRLKISEDRQTVDLGPGLRWGAVYETLEKNGLTTIGGRDAGVGVPGFVFGGRLMLIHDISETETSDICDCRWHFILFQCTWLGY